jgi:hypothetical protein
MAYRPERDDTSFISGSNTGFKMVNAGTMSADDRDEGERCLEIASGIVVLHSINDDIKFI